MVGHISSVGNTFLRVLVIKDSAYNQSTRLIVLVLIFGIVLGTFGIIGK
jgi:hypothetical protein